MTGHSLRFNWTLKNNSERPVDALAENGKLPTHLLTTSNQEMLAHLKKILFTEAQQPLDQPPLFSHPTKKNYFVKIKKNLFYRSSTTPRSTPSRSVSQPSSNGTSSNSPNSTTTTHTTIPITHAPPNVTNGSAAKHKPPNPKLDIAAAR